ncbi:MAG: class 1 fructose-bisphosphatase [Candidatus Rokubacteria bacterium]|nr:class 1 fructose-bisphosphatase [Candidatus Rokubacteria bacterium]
MITTDAVSMPILSHHLRRERAAHPALTEELAALLVELALAGKIIAREVGRAALTGRLGETGETNVQGERVKELDRWTNEAMVDVLRRSGLVCTMVSEEMEKPLHLDDACATGRYLVCFDPVDGSSNTDINGIVGTIFGVRARRGTADHAADALGPGTAQVAAGYIMYGPATVVVYTVGHGVHGLTLDTMTGEYMLTHPDLRIPSRGKTYSVNEGNWHRWGSAPRDFIASLSGERDGARPYSLRYVGSLVADFHRTLLEGGIYLYPAEVDSRKARGKIRLLYEAAPLALVVEQAGGRASTGTERILEVMATEYHQRVPLLIGSPEEVARAESFHRREPT